MSDSRYVPHHFSAEPSSFGRAKDMRWREDIPDEQRPQRAAAELQHRYALRIRARMRAGEGMTGREYAESVGSSYDRTMKILRGQLIMRLEDIAAADLLLGKVSEFDIREEDFYRGVLREERERAGAADQARQRLEREVEAHFMSYR
ncbi:hypothetical protein [Marisediminicola sp. LYQ134]|uniref:hypothetical protein n=1 Tax=Marisediminicola sp. LYQ134 TaxID=3391061 RepID=UPI003983B2A0